MFSMAPSKIHTGALFLVDLEYFLVDLDSIGHLELFCWCILIQTRIALGAILVLCTFICYIHEKLCIFVYNGLNSHGCTYIYNFSKFEYFMYFWWTSFVIHFFLVLVRFQFSRSIDSTTGSVLITLVGVLFALYASHHLTIESNMRESK